ncbi:MAG: phage scaffolding protein [Ruminococcus flavefaciens]|nr:phage scaffolding protein [Ruminococcus flavefaciens]
MAEETKSTEAVPEENKPEKIPEQVTKTYSEQEYNALKSQLDTANDTIKSYEKMDIDGIKASVEDYKQKWEQSENDRKDFEHRTKIGSYVKSLALRDDIYEKHVADLILEKGLKFDGEKLIGGDDVVNNFKTKYPNAFKSAQPVPEFSVSTTGQSGMKDDDAFVRKVMGLK